MNHSHDCVWTIRELNLCWLTSHPMVDFTPILSLLLQITLHEISLYHQAVLLSLQLHLQPPLNIGNIFPTSVNNKHSWQNTFMLFLQLFSSYNVLEITPLVVCCLRRVYFVNILDTNCQIILWKGCANLPSFCQCDADFLLNLSWYPGVCEYFFFFF